MRVIVAHEGKQHVNQLLVGLSKQGWLQRFYVGFASNHLPKFLLQSTRLAHWLKKKQFDGFDSQLIRSHYVSTLLSRLTKDHLKHIQITFRLFDSWVATSLKREDKFDVLIGYENCNLLAFRAAKQSQKLTILDLAQIHHHTIKKIQQNFPVTDLSASQTALVDRRKQAALAYTDYVLALSSFATQSLTDNGISRNRIYEVNLGIDPTHFCPAPKRKDGTFQLLFTGTITYRKGLEPLISAFRNLNLPDAELLLVGPVGDAGALLTQCTGAIRHIPFLHHEDLVAYYQQADVFVFPSYLDSWGQVVLEAMACGTPVIISDNTGAKDAVAKGGGFVVPTGDEGALQEKIRYVYEHRDEAERMGREARRVAEQYTWANYHQQIADALTDIAHRENITL